MAHNFTTTVSQPSKVLSDVTLTVRRLSSVERAKRDLIVVLDTVRIAELNELLKALAEPWQKFNEKGEPIADSGPPMPLDVRVEYEKLDREMGAIMNSALKPATVRAGFVSATGLLYDGKEATAELILANGPDDLINEVWALIEAHQRLSVEEKKTSQSSGTTDVAEPQALSSSTAAGANAPASIDAEIAPSIFPTK